MIEGVALDPGRLHPLLYVTITTNLHRWASTGLEFITIAIAPRMLSTISQTRFEALKKLVDRCVDHIVGEAPAPVRKGEQTIL